VNKELWSKSFTLLIVLHLFCLFFVVNNTYALEKRVALVIGNSNYSESPLTNPVNDASDISNALEKLGFNVELSVDLSYLEINQKVQEFSQQLNEADVGFFYFAGHGIQVNGTNYLIPASTDLSDENAIINEAISTSSILKIMEDAGNGINIVVLDACRNNPLSQNFQSSAPNEKQVVADTSNSRGLVVTSLQGLAIIEAPSASFIAYSTAPGSVAADGSGKNGLYTQYLLENINNPDQSIEEMFKKVRVSVVQDSKGKQVPWENSSLLGEFYFVEPVESDLLTEGGQYYSADHLELEFWKAVQKDPSQPMYESYLKEFPEGNFSLLAREKLKLLGNGMVTISSNVFGDSIKVNGDFRGTSKSTLSLEPNEYEIEVSKYYYEKNKSSREKTHRVKI